jgi:hypothetical protein
LINILCVVGLLQWGGPAAGDSFDDYILIRDDIFFELDRPLSADDTNGVQARRETLRQLFWQIPPEFALDFYDELGTSDNGDEFSALFHGRLAPSTREEMLEILLAIDTGESQRDFEFEGDNIEDIDVLSAKEASSAAKIDQYLNESRFKVRSGLEQAFKDYRVWFRDWNEREDVAVVRLIKELIGTVYNVIMVVVPSSGTWTDLFETQVATPFMEMISAQEKDFRVDDADQFLDLLEKKYGEFVLDAGMQVYDVFRKSPEYAGAVDMFMENFEQNTLGGDGSLPADVATVLDNEGVPSPSEATQERVRECALVGLVADTIRDVQVATDEPVWEAMGWGSPEEAARDVVGGAILDRSPFQVCS